jgi:hypothetical protein
MAEADLVGDLAAPIILESLVEQVASERATAGKGLHDKAVPALGDRREHILGLEPAAQAPARADGPAGEPRQHRGEVFRLLAELFELREPRPAQREQLG